jgi:hypothetical protein
MGNHQSRSLDFYQGFRVLYKQANPPGESSDSNSLQLTYTYFAETHLIVQRRLWRVAGGYRYGRGDEGFFTVVD